MILKILAKLGSLYLLVKSDQGKLKDETKAWQWDERSGTLDKNTLGIWLKFTPWYDFDLSETEKARRFTLQENHVIEK